MLPANVLSRLQNDSEVNEAISSGTLTLATLETKQVTVSDIINVHIPKTNDLHDAYNSAVQILSAAYGAMVNEAKSEGTSVYRLIVIDARDYVARAHAEYLKGGN